MRSTDEHYGSLAYDGALLLCDPLCISRAFLVFKTIKYFFKIMRVKRRAPTLACAVVRRHPVADWTAADERALNITTQSVTQPTDAVFLL